MNSLTSPYTLLTVASDIQDTYANEPAKGRLKNDATAV